MWARFGFFSNSFCVYVSSCYLLPYSFTFSSLLSYARIPQFLSFLAASLTCICILIQVMPISHSSLFSLRCLFLDLFLQTRLRESSICAFLRERKKRQLWHGLSLPCALQLHLIWVNSNIRYSSWLPSLFSSNKNLHQPPASFCDRVAFISLSPILLQAVRG